MQQKARLTVDREAAHRFTVQRIVLADMLLNWFLGAALTGFPSAVDRLLGTAPFLPLWVARAIGVIFLLFAGWQTVIVARRRMGRAALVFSAAMALVPVVLLAIALLFMGLPLRPGWRIALWAGNVYMLLLGCWYLYLARAARTA
jgi:Kef-type K+ transport system membrane component KefB